MNARLAEERDGLGVGFDVAAVKADRDEGFDQGRAVLEADGAFDVRALGILLKGKNTYTVDAIDPLYVVKF